MKQELILIKVGEIALKGLNRRTFEDVQMCIRDRKSWGFPR